MDITLLISGDLANGYEAVRPIVLEAQIVMEEKEQYWLITDTQFDRYGAHDEFRLAVAECLADMTSLLEACQDNCRDDNVSCSQAEDLERYLRRSESYELHQVGKNTDVHAP